MKKLFFVLFILPVLAFGQVNGTIQLTPSTKVLRYIQGSELDSIPNITGTLTNGYTLEYNSTKKKWDIVPGAALIDTSVFARKTWLHQGYGTIFNQTNGQIKTDTTTLNGKYIPNSISLHTGNFNISGIGKASSFNSLAYKFGTKNGLSYDTAKYVLKIGENAGLGNTIGMYNLYIGPFTGTLNSTNSMNTAIQYGALFHNIGEHNFAAGINSQYEGLAAADNVTVGNGTLQDNTYGDFSAGLGFNALQHNNWIADIYHYMLGVGYNAGKGKAGLTRSTRDTFVGPRSGELNETASNEIYLGYCSGCYIKGGNHDIIIAVNPDSTNMQSTTDSTYHFLNIGNSIYARNLYDTTAVIGSIGGLPLAGTTWYVKGTGRYTGALTANSFVKIGGTSSQILLADGTTIPTSTYGANPLTTTGDIIYSSSGSTGARRGIGSTGDVLTVSGGVPVWAAPSVISNYITTNTTQTGLTGDKTSNANWTFGTVNASGSSGNIIYGNGSSSAVGVRGQGVDGTGVYGITTGNGIAVVGDASGSTTPASRFTAGTGNGSQIINNSSASTTLSVTNNGSGTLATFSNSGGSVATISNTGGLTTANINGNTITTGTGVLTLGAGKTLTNSNTLTLTANDGSTLAIGGGGTLGSNAYTSTAYAPIASPTFTGVVTMPTPFTLGATSVTTTPAQLNYLNIASSRTGTGAVVLNTSPALIAPTFSGYTGAAASIGVTSGSGLYLTGITGSTYDMVLANNVGSIALGLKTGGVDLAALGALTVTGATTLSALSTNGLVTTSGGTGALSVTVPGTGVLTALGVNVGSAGAPVLFNGAGGTPSSLVGTNITGTAAGLTAGNVTTNANLTGVVTSSGNATSFAASPAFTGTWSGTDNLTISKAGTVGFAAANTSTGPAGRGFGIWARQSTASSDFLYDNTSGTGFLNFYGATSRTNAITGVFTSATLGLSINGTAVNVPVLTTGIVGNTSGTLATITALPNGTTTTTQSAGNNSTNLATTAYADNAGEVGGSTTLVLGTKAVSITGVTTSSIAVVSAQTAGTTVPSDYTVVCTAGTITITSVVFTTGLTNTADTSVINYIVKKAP